MQGREKKKREQILCKLSSATWDQVSDPSRAVLISEVTNCHLSQRSEARQSSREPRSPRNTSEYHSETLLHSDFTTRIWVSACLSLTSGGWSSNRPLTGPCTKNSFKNSRHTQACPAVTEWIKNVSGLAALAGYTVPFHLTEGELWVVWRCVVKVKNVGFFMTELWSEQIKTATSSRLVKCVITIQLAAFFFCFFLIVKTQTREQMWWETPALPFTVKSRRSYHKMTSSPCLTLTGGETVHPPSTLHPPPPRPPPPSRLLTTLAVRLSHTDVISSPTAGAYGNVTGRWWWWLLAHFLSSHGGETLCGASPPWRDRRGSNRKQVAHRRSLTRGIVHVSYKSFNIRQEQRFRIIFCYFIRLRRHISAANTELFTSQHLSEPP